MFVRIAVVGILFGIVGAAEKNVEEYCESDSASDNPHDCLDEVTFLQLLKAIAAIVVGNFQTAVAFLEIDLGQEQNRKNTRAVERCVVKMAEQITQSNAGFDNLKVTLNEKINGKQQDILKNIGDLNVSGFQFQEDLKDSALDELAEVHTDGVHKYNEEMRMIQGYLQDWNTDYDHKTNLLNLHFGAFNAAMSNFDARASNNGWEQRLKPFFANMTMQRTNQKGTMLFDDEGTQSLTKATFIKDVCSENGTVFKDLYDFADTIYTGDDDKQTTEWFTQNKQIEMLTKHSDWKFDNNPEQIDTSSVGTAAANRTVANNWLAERDNHVNVTLEFAGKPNDKNRYQNDEQRIEGITLAKKMCEDNVNLRVDRYYEQELRDGLAKVQLKQKHLVRAKKDADSLILQLIKAQELTVTAQDNTQNNLTTAKNNGDEAWDDFVRIYDIFCCKKDDDQADYMGYENSKATRSTPCKDALKSFDTLRAYGTNSGTNNKFCTGEDTRYNDYEETAEVSNGPNVATKTSTPREMPGTLATEVRKFDMCKITEAIEWAYANGESFCYKGAFYVSKFGQVEKDKHKGKRI